MQRSSAGWQGPSFPNSRSCDTRLCEPLCKPLYGRWFERCKKQALRSKRPREIGCEKRSALGQRLLKTKPVCQQTMQKRRKQAKPAPTSKRPPVASRRPCEPTHHLFRALIALAAVQPQAPGRRRCAGTPCAGARHEEEQWWLEAQLCAYSTHSLRLRSTREVCPACYLLRRKPDRPGRKSAALRHSLPCHLA